MRAHVPEENYLVAADGDEAVVVLCDCYIVDFVAVGRVFLDFEGGGGIEEADMAVGAAGQEVLACSGAVAEGEDLAIVACKT